MAQTADIDGSGNNTVQIIGDGNSVTLQRAAALRISRYPEGSSRAQIRREFDLLKPYARALDMVGREDERRSLRDWLTSEEKLSVRVLTGQGGSGKTRLALDLCDHLPSEDWQAGFVDGDDLKIFCNDATSVDWAWSRPTLVVIDYAATTANTLHRWLGEPRRPWRTTRRPLRILLLERQADQASGLVANRVRRRHGQGRGDQRSARTRPAGRHPAAGEHGRAPPRDLSRRRCHGRRRSSARTRRPATTANPSTNASTSSPGAAEPLFLMMAAMLAARDGVPESWR